MHQRKMMTPLTIFLASCLINTCLTGRVKRQRIIFPDEIDVQTTTTTSTISTTTAACDCQSTTTNEYNPVCGSDGITYWNPQKLNCAAKCGTNVRQTKGGRCGPLIGG